MFDALGADVRVINAAPDGFNINVDCGSTHIERLQRHVVEQGLDVGFAYDGDADRCLAVDERGRVVDGDQILYVCGVYLNKHGRLSGGTVVPTIASNFGLIKSLELAGLSAVTSGVGDRHVYAKMREGGYSLGGEQTGHTIFGDIERTGDGIMTSLRVMEVIRAERETLSHLISGSGRGASACHRRRWPCTWRTRTPRSRTWACRTPSPRPRLRWQARAACSCARVEPSRLSACWPRRPTKHPPMPP